MWQPVYAVLISLAGFLFLPFWLIRARGKGRAAWPFLRMGLCGQGLTGLPKGGIWLHALSVGEVNSAIPVVKALRRRYPDLPLYFSVATITGSQLAARELGHMCYLLVRPLDVPWAVKHWLRSLRPSFFILLESDMWPGWQRAIKKAGIKSALLNARISPRSLRGYLRCRPVARLLYKDFDAIAVQSPLDAQRFEQLGISQTVHGWGNLKFDSLPAPLSNDQRAQLAARFGLSGPVVVCGSTHAGEEKLCIEAWLSLQQENVSVVIAPRHSRRTQEILALLPPNSGWLASQGPLKYGRKVLVLDVMGQLAKIYALANVAFIGGSLVKEGGHNALEAAIQGVAVVFGPHMEDFAEMADGLLEAGAAYMVTGAQELAATWHNLLTNEAQANAMGQRGQAFCAARQGASERIVNALAEMINA